MEFGCLAHQMMSLCFGSLQSVCHVSATVIHIFHITVDAVQLLK
jgi:hypothetical protein